MVASSFIVLGGCANAPPTQLPTALVAPAAMSGDALVRRLTKGGYVLYLRHGKTEYAFQDKLDKPGWWKSCDTRNSRALSDEGRAQMLAVGASIRELGIPVARVETSEYCRAFDSGLLLQLKPVATNSVLNFPDAQRTLGRSDLQMMSDLRVLFGTPAPRGANVILIGHVHGFTPPIDAVFNALFEGETAVLKPLAEGRFELVGRIRAETWALRAK